MQTKAQFWFKTLLPGLLIAVLALGGCGGDGSDGSDGSDGVDGVDGLDGADGADGADGQSGSTVEDLLALNPDFLDDLVALNPQLDLSNTIDYDPTTGVVTAHFFLTDGTEANNGVDVFTDAYELRFYVAELILNDDGTDTGGQSWNRLIYERGTPAVDDRLGGTLTLIDAETGEYTYIFENTLPVSDNVFRVTARARWRETVGDTRYVFANPVNANYDFLQADPGTELASSGADMVSTEACESCHGARIGNVGHGGGYTKVKTCNNCHNINYMTTERDNGGEGDLAFMIHRIHTGGVFDRLGGGEDFSRMTYPQETYTCSKCHTEDAPDANLHAEIVTRANCGSCHDNIDFTETNPESPSYHPAGPYENDLSCDDCHGPGKFANVTDKHDPNLNPDIRPAKNVSEYEVTITMTPPDNGTHYVAGETPLVTVTLVGDNPVNYTADQDAKGTADGNLSTANLYVYGPRANPVPVLTTDSTTDGGNDQGRSLFLVGNAPPVDDLQVATDADGYKYQLMDNIGDLQPGTYMVRFEGEDYGDFDDVDYHTASSGLITFQVGTAEEEPKVSGDACMNCHGDTAMHVEGPYSHHQLFDTDGCLGCHDVSGNYANYLGNRVHAVHSASITGDLKTDSDTGLRKNWSEVHFPRPANNCRTCHTNSEAAVPVWRDPNEVACGGCHGANPEAVPADYTPAFDPADIVEEVAAATHMREMGGTFDVDSTNPDDPDYVVRQCIICHGEGRIADLFKTHGLVNFPVTDTSTPED